MTQELINTAIMEASTDTIDPSTVTTLLSSKASIDDNGNILINGKDVKTAVAELVKEKPFLGKSAPVNNGVTLSAVERLTIARQGVK